MGKLRSAYLNSRGLGSVAQGFTGTPGGFTPTEPGNPDFSLAQNPDSQAQFPAAAAEKRLYDNSRQAENLLAKAQAFGVDINAPEYAAVREAADSGVIERALTMGERLIGYVDGPRQFVNLMIQDIANGSSGKRDPNFGDYVDALWGGIEREHRNQFIAETGLDPMSGSKTLELFGWELEDTTGGRFARGVADFGMQVLTDPLSYVTFGLSGLGKGVAKATAAKFQASVASRVLNVAHGARATASPARAGARRVGREALEIGPAGLAAKGTNTRRGAYYELSKYEQRLVRSLTDITRNFTQTVLREADPQTISALSTWLRKEKGIITHNTDDILRYAHDFVEELALHNRLAQDVMQPLLRRDFAAIAPDALELLPAYARGGARLSFPFLGKASLERGIDIPGTRGLGRRLVGEPIRKRAEQLRQYSVFSKIFRTTDSITNSMSRERAMIRALGKGTLEGWQYHIAGHAFDSLTNGAQRDAAKVIINAEFSMLRELGAKIGVTDNGVIFSDIWNRLEKRAALGTEGPNPLKDFLFDQSEGFQPPTSLNQVEIEAAGLSNYEHQLDAVATLIQDTQASYMSILNDILPPTSEGQAIIKNLTTSIPHQLTPKGRLLMAQLAEKGDVFVRSAALAAQRDGHVGPVLLDEMVHSISSGGRIEQQLGSTRYADSRVLSATTAMALTDTGVINIPKESLLRAAPQTQGVIAATGELMPENLKPSYMTVPELNAEFEAAIRQIAEDPSSGIVLPRNWDGKVFDDNPLNVIGGYIDNLHEVVKLWQTVEALKVAGLAFPSSQGLDIGATGQAIYKNVMDNAVTVISTRKISDIDPPGTVYHATSREGIAQTSRKVDPGFTLHFGTSKAALDRIGIARGKDVLGHVEAATLEFKKPLGSPSDPVFDLSIDASGNDWVDRVIPELGHPLDPEWNTSSYVEDVARLREEGYDVIIYRNSTEDKNSISYAVLDPSIIKSHAVRTVGTMDEGVDVLDRNVIRGYQEAVERAAVQSLRSKKLADEAGFDIFDREGNKNLMILLNKTESQFAAMVPESVAPYVPTPDELESGLRTGEVLNEFGEIVGGTADSQIDDGFRSADELDSLGENMRAEKVMHSLGYDPIERSGRPTWYLEGFSRGNRQARILRDENGHALAVVNVFGDLTTTNASITVLRSTANDEVDDLIVSALSSMLLTSPAGAHATFKNISRLMAFGGVGKVEARYLHKTLRRQLASLDDDTLHFLTNGEPAELTRLRTWFEDFANQMNKLIGGYGHYFDPQTGHILPTKANPEFKLLADDGYINLLDETRRMAAESGIEGIEDLFRNVEQYRGLADRPKFVNPAIFALGGPAVDKLVLQRDVAQWMRQLARNSATIYTPEGVAALKLQTNQVLRLWRSMATIMRPGFHVRNLIGGVWNNQIVGVRMRDYIMVRNNGIKFRNALRSGMDPEKAFAQLDPHARKIFKAAWDNDVMTGFATSEFRKLSPSERASRLDFMKLHKDEFLLNQVGGKVMESIEDFLRVSAFAAWYDPDNPATVKVAKEMAEAVHFNYSNLTPMETKIKSLVPFFVWTKNNLPLQLRVMAENPRIIQRYRAMMQSMSDNLGGDEEGMLPEGDNFSAFAAGTDYKVHPNTPFWARVIIDPDLPVRDLIDIPGMSPPQVAEFANGLLGPHVSMLFDLNKEREFGDVNAPAPFNSVLKALAFTGWFDTTASGDVRIPYWMRTVIETGLPITRDVIEPFFGGPTDPARQQRSGISEEAGGLESAITSLGATIARGAGIKFSTPTDVRQSAGRTSIQLDQIVQQLRLQGIQPPSEGS